MLQLVGAYIENEFACEHTEGKHPGVVDAYTKVCALRPGCKDSASKWVRGLQSGLQEDLVLWWPGEGLVAQFWD